MTAFTFSAEQLRAAPIEVRRWVASEIARSVAGLAETAPERAPPEPPTESAALAACTPGEALQMLELVGGDPVVGRIFFELARDGAGDSGVPGLAVLGIADLMRHAGIADNETLIAGLSAIDRAFRQARGDQAGNLFGFGDTGQLYVHDATQASIRRVWEELMRAEAVADRHSAPARPDFVPPHLGPSEDVAAHEQRISPKAAFR